MKITLAATLRHYDKKNFIKDLLAGIIIMAVSIPISMGYAQIAGLPAVYGLYGSVFPILIFALFSTSPQFIFGVDAAPAALIGSALLSLHIESGSEEAMAVVPVLTFFVALWLLAFLYYESRKTGQLYIGTGYGRIHYRNLYDYYTNAGTEADGRIGRNRRVFELTEHIIKTAKDINWQSVVLGLAALVLLLVCKKLIPKFPMAVLLMIAGAGMTYLLPIEDWGVQTLASVDTGLPHWAVPDFSVISIREAVTISLSVAVVIMAETLLAENNFAQKNGYRINDNQEILAFSMGNFLAAFTGCCPINGSVSRTAMGEQYQAKTQLTGIIAGLSMIVVLSVRPDLSVIFQFLCLQLL